MKRATVLSLLLVAILSVGAHASIHEVDVVVIGGGGGGLSAAVSAAENGASVVVLEKMPFVGGNTLLSTGAFYAATSLHSLSTDRELASETVAETILRSAAGTANEPLVRFLASESGNSINWLQTVGVEFLPGRDLAVNGGAGVIFPLMEAAKSRGVEVLLDTKAVELLTEDGNAVGVRAEQNGEVVAFHAGAVIIATGGFGANEQMIKEYKPEYAGLPITCTPAATGDGIRMAQAIGAATVDMDKVMPVPTAAAENYRLITAMMRGDAGASIFVNEQGKRFVDETILYEPLTLLVIEELEKQKRDYLFQVFDQSAIENVPIAASYVSGGVTVQADSLAELAQKLDVDPDTFVASIERYNADITAGNADEFGRTTAMRPLEKAPFYAIKIVPGQLATRGGLVIDEFARVLAEDGQPIGGLYAAGETTGGIFGGGYQGGAFLTVAITFGRIAGAQAAIDVLSK